MAVRAQVPATRRVHPLADRTGFAGPRWLVPGLLAAGLIALTCCLVVGGSLTTEPLPGLPDAGAATRWGLPVASFIAETAGVLALGAALLVTALIPHQRGDVAVRARCLRTAGSFAALTALAGLVVFVLTVSDLTARSLPGALTVRAITEVAAFGPGLLLLISAAASAGGAVLCRRAARRQIGGKSDMHLMGEVAATVVLAAALIPWALGGHTAQAGQDIAAPSLIVHVLAASAWIGGLTIMVLSIRGELLTAVLPRFSTLALWCWIWIGVSGVITGRLRIGQVSDLWTSGYGRLLLVKLLCLGILGLFGAWHRRRISTGLRTMTIGQRGALLRVAAVEILVMGATMGVATALSATAPPVGHATGHDSVHGTARIEALTGHRVPVISAENLALLWRPDVIVLLLVAVALTCYLAGARRVRMAGRNWPAARTCWVVIAGAVTVLALNSGVATYDGVVWSVAVTQQAVTSMVIPLAVVLARPWELFTDRGDGRRRLNSPVRRWDLSARPWLVFAGYAVWSAGCLLTPVALWSVSNHAVLMTVKIGDIVVGTAFFLVVLTNAASPKTAERRRPSSTVLLMAWFAVEIGISVALLFDGAAPARSWFTQLNLAWITVAQDERTAALTHIVIAMAVLLLAAAMPTGKAISTLGTGTSLHPVSTLPPGLFETPDNEMCDGPIISLARSESELSSTSVTSVRRQ